jgi:hypothetical protein
MVHRLPRDAALRNLYLDAALADIPRLLGAIDRNPYHATYGCLDRSFWHYRTASFPSEMYQEGVLPLAMAYRYELPGNRWHDQPRVRELAIAALGFCARSAHADGSCDDYYPFERALGAAAFSLLAAARAYHLLTLDDPRLRGWLELRGRWLIDHDESGTLANHQALTALGLWEVGRITGKREYQEASRARIARLLAWQSDEGWFEEYGGADPGYLTVTIDCLARHFRETGDPWLLAPVRRAAGFARNFLHGDGSYGGVYGSRGTRHFYPHGMELLAADNADAADLADGFLRGLQSGKQAFFSDDRMFAHRTANLLEAYLDWSPLRPPPGPEPREPFRYFPQSGLLVCRTTQVRAVVSAARGGVFQYFTGGGDCTSDAGLVLATDDGRIAVSQCHDRQRQTHVLSVAPPEQTDGCLFAMRIVAMLDWVRHETATPVKQAVFHTGMWCVGRCFRTWVRKLLQRRLVTGRRKCPIRLTRQLEFLAPPPGCDAPVLRVTDAIELLDPDLRVRRMHFGTDQETAYVAASGVYQDSVLASWTDLAGHVEELNARRTVTIVRNFGGNRRERGIGE